MFNVVSAVFQTFIVEYTEEKSRKNTEKAYHSAIYRWIYREDSRENTERTYHSAIYRWIYREESRENTERTYHSAIYRWIYREKSREYGEDLPAGSERMGLSGVLFFGIGGLTVVVGTSKLSMAKIFLRIKSFLILAKVIVWISVYVLATELSFPLLINLRSGLFCEITNEHSSNKQARRRNVLIFCQHCSVIWPRDLQQ